MVETGKENSQRSCKDNSLHEAIDCDPHDCHGNYCVSHIRYKKILIFLIRNFNKISALRGNRERQVDNLYILFLSVFKTFTCMFLFVKATAEFSPKCLPVS